MTVLATLAGRAWAAVVSAAVTLGALVLAYARGRASAHQAAELAARRAEQARQEKADDAASAYRRSGGALERLRDGRF